MIYCRNVGGCQTKCYVTHELSHLAYSFVRQLRCAFRGIALAMQRKPRLVDTQNSSAILQHFIHDTTLRQIHFFAAVSSAPCGCRLYLATLPLTDTQPHAPSK